MMVMITCKTFLALWMFVSCSQAYKPVVLIHGIMTGSGSMEVISRRIQEVSTTYFSYIIPQNKTLILNANCIYYRNILVPKYIMLIGLKVGQVWRPCGIKFWQLVMMLLTCLVIIQKELI